jgi:hypothetical protein
MQFGFSINWVDFIGLLIMLAGFVIGLGAVTVIDIHGFLGRGSAYWTEATTRTHKVTKPMIWVGIALIILGSFVVYSDNNIFLAIQLLVGVVLMLNGLFLSFKVSPFLLERERQGRSRDLLPKDWQNKIMAGLIISDIGWWGSLVMLAAYLVHT